MPLNDRSWLSSVFEVGPQHDRTTDQTARSAAFRPLWAAELPGRAINEWNTNQRD
jgi:hypothetical protein